MTRKNQYDDHNVITKYVMARNVGRAVAKITFMLIGTLFKYAAVHSIYFRNKPIDGDSSVCGADCHFYQCY